MKSVHYLLALMGALSIPFGSASAESMSSQEQSATSLSDATALIAAAEPAHLGSVTVTSGRMPWPVLDTAASVTTVTADTIRHELGGNIRRMVRYLPAISVPKDPTRFGRQGFSIRGIGGNRVLTLLDGVPVSDSYSIGNFSNAGRDFVDPSVIKRVDIIRGPASALYGSGALGGVVSFHTKDPDDYLAQTSGDVYLGFGAGYSSVDDGAMATVTTAFGGDIVQGMVVYTRRQGHEFANQGTVQTHDASRTAPNPQAYSADNLLLKGVLHGDATTLRVTLDGHRSDTQTRVFSSLSATDYTQQVGFPYVIEKTAMRGDDSERRTRLSANLDFEDGASGWFDRGKAVGYFQYSRTEQKTRENRRKTIMANATDYSVRRDFNFSQHVVGASLTLNKSLSGHLDHTLVYGLDVRRTGIDEMRDGSQKNLTTGTTTTTVGPDDYPVRDFPLSTTVLAGIFIQDQIGFLDGELLLVPGLRYDYYRLDADNDPVFNADNPDVRPKDLSESDVSPRLGVVYKLTGNTSLFGQYAHGFHAPSYDAVNVGFTNLQFGYTAIPNLNLKPETSNAVELGIKHYGSAGYFVISGYYDRFDDFIETLVSLGVDPSTGLLTFQSRNVGEVTIYGIEFRGTWFLDGIARGLRLTTNLAWGRGNDETVDQPLNSVAPPEAVIGLGYYAPDDSWSVRVMGRFVKRKDRLNTASGGESQFEAPGYGTLDLLGSVRLARNIELVGGLFNLTDKTYWDWSTVLGRPANDPVRDRYSQPGFHAGLSLYLHW